MSPSPGEETRIAGTEAAEEIAPMHALCFPASPWPEASFREMLAIPGTFAVMAPGGFLLLRMSEEEAEILSMGVSPARRRQGTGRRLVEKALAFMAGKGVVSVFLEVSEHNAPAFKLYKGAGFTKIGERKNYYTKQGAGENAILMKICIVQKKNQSL